MKTTDNRLPEGARAKLLLLEGAALDALDAARSAHERLNGLGQRDDPNRARLANVIETQRERHAELSALVSGARQWLRELPPNAALEAAPPRPVETVTGESLKEALAARRRRIRELRLDLRRVSLAPPPKADQKRQARGFVKGLAERGRPKLKIDRGQFEADFSDPMADFGVTAGFVASALAWLDPEALAKRLEAEIDAQPEAPLSLTESARAKRMAELGGEIDKLEREEEALIAAAAEQGQDVLRRADADPAAVLGVVVTDAKATLQAA
jgi:hypothetical protein